MVSHNEIVKQQLSEQIAIEEHLCGLLQQQIAEIDQTDFSDAKDLLIQTAEVLEKHFETLNKLLDKQEKEELSARLTVASGNGGPPIKPLQREGKGSFISRILLNDYSALNLITISNTLLHTTALALDCQDVASAALKHLENLAPFVVRIGKLLPEVATRELRANSVAVDLSIAKTALENTQLAWRRAS